MRYRVLLTGLLLVLSALSGLLYAETQYIDDTLFAPIRSGQGNEFRIVHKGVRSGTPVEVVEQDKTSGYSLVRTPGGLEGWLPSRYLTPQPIARTQLDALQKEHEKLKKELATLQQDRSALDSTRGTLEQDLLQTRDELGRTQAELANLRRVSANALQLDERNQKLRLDNKTLQDDVEVLRSENARLKDKTRQDTMILGAGLVLLGVFIAVVVPMFRRPKRSGWA